MIGDIASIATALGVILAAIGLWLTRQQAVTSFEDSLAHEYRKLASEIPTKAFLGEDLSDAEYAEHLDEVYHYFDLTNSQVFLRQLGRVRRGTWEFWCEGIRSNLARPAFARAWAEISRRADNDFSELRRLIVQDYRSDPRRWRRE